MLCGVLLYAQMLQLFSQQSHQKLEISLIDPFGFPIEHATIFTQDTQFTASHHPGGIYSLILPINRQHTLLIRAQGYVSQVLEYEYAGLDSKRMALVLTSLGHESGAAPSQEAFLMSETAVAALSDDAPAGFLLQATRDVFVASAAFDFSQAFFKPKGLDSKYGKVFLNGIEMNKYTHGRPQWSDWGGLNSLTRNQEYTHDIQSNQTDFGGLLGTTAIDLSPSKQRPGLNFSTALSNRSYALREMLSFVSSQKNGLSYSLSGSIRRAKRGYQQGTPYSAYSAMGSIEYQWPSKFHQTSLSVLHTYNQRGRSAALSTEVVRLLGRDYNPYWGMYQGKLRSSRNKTLSQSMFIFNHSYERDAFGFSVALSYNQGKDFRDRLAYFNAANPDPIYYKNLPSYYLNSPIGANFYSAQTAREALLAAPQIQWDRIYAANKNQLGEGQLPYLLTGDQMQERQWSFVARWFWKPLPDHEFDAGISIRVNPTDYFGQIQDLLGGQGQLDIDPFSQTRNDLKGNLIKKKGDYFGYHYQLKTHGERAYVQWRHNGRRWDAFASLTAQRLSSSRRGLMQNERYPNNSLGQGPTKSFNTHQIKSGLSYKFNGKHWLSLTAMSGAEPPVLSQWYVNPRNHGLLSPNISPEAHVFIEANYYLRAPKLMGRFNIFYGRFKDQTSLRFYFAETALGSDFVQEWVQGQQSTHKGLEFGFNYKLSSAVQLNFSGSLARYQVANNPNLSLFFDPDTLELAPINTGGQIDLGAVQLAQTALPQGPSRAFSLGVSYRDPKYWWLTMSFNSLGLSYVGPSYLRRTAQFSLDPIYDPSDLTDLEKPADLKQTSLPNFILVNLVGGKSWLKQGRYVSVFLSVNNLLNTYYRTGGYEQSRKAYLQVYNEDQRGGTPSFDTKYWQGSGRTFFLNLMLSLPPNKLKKSKKQSL